MAWVRIDDEVSHHPKFIHVGPIAGWLWLCGLCYCNRYLTDGFIPHSALKTVAGVTKPARWAARLVDAGLWTVDAGGYRVHDYLRYQQSADSVKLKRDSDRNRKGKYADSAQTPESPAPARAGDVSSSVGCSFLEKGSGGKPFAEGSSHSTPLHRQFGDHRAHHGPACFLGSGVCVPSVLHAEFIGKCGFTGSEAEAHAEAFYVAVNREWAGRTIGDDAFTFWRLRWQEAHGTTKQAMTVTKATAQVDAMQKGTERFVNRG